MVAQGHAVTVFCRQSHAQARPASLDGIDLRYLPALRGKHVETISHTLLAAAAAARHDAVVCMGVGNAPVVRLLELAGHRTVFNVDGADWERAKWGRGAAAYLRAAEVMAAHSRSIIVADAEVVRLHYLEKHHRETRLLAYGATPPADTGMAALQRLGVEPRAYALFVGRLEPENGADDFLAGVARSGVDLVPLVVGGVTYPGEYVDQLHTTAPSNAVFAGFQFGADYQQLTSHAALFVLAAKVGGTHPVLLEQMAAGNCILARDTPANREVLGDAGFYWDTPADLATRLADLRDSPAEAARLGAAARERQRLRYDWDEVTAGYLELCAEAASHRRRDAA